MQLENREPDETVNYSEEHPLKEFVWLAGGIVAVVVIATALIGWFAGTLAAWLPYRYERDFAEGIANSLQSQVLSDAARNSERELNALALRVAAAMELPPDMRITLHFNPAPVVNAYATLGGNISAYQGLIARMPDENALAMVIAHEIAHVKLRHPAQAMGRGVAVGIVLSVVSSSTGRSAAGNLVGTAGMATVLKFSRDQERAADAEALRALHRVYGHVGGAADVFTVLASAAPGGESNRVSMLTTHPLSAERSDAIATLARENGWPLDGPRQPLSAGLQALKLEKKTP